MALVELASFYNKVEADLVRARLAAQGIDCVLFDSEMSWIGSAVPVRVMIDQEDEVAATALVTTGAGPPF